MDQTTKFTLQDAFKTSALSSDEQSHLVRVYTVMVAGSITTALSCGYVLLEIPKSPHHWAIWWQNFSGMMVSLLWFLCESSDNVIRLFVLLMIISACTGLIFVALNGLFLNFEPTTVLAALCLLLQRVQLQVASKVAGSQFGFVGQRQVHEAIDVWAAIQARVKNGELPSTATAVMLDFAKACDTLDRTFLRKALVFHGFPVLVIAAIDAMHLATTARFLADGDMSAVVDIHNGIRQGCPLAPVLFVLALDLLYKAADATTGLSGLQLAPTVKVTLAGYADDTTAYLPHPDEEQALLGLLEAFGAASGLRINVAKSRAVAIHPTGPQAAHASMVIPVLGTTELLRLLGMAVASSPISASIWLRTLQQVRATLHIANVKTTNILQRITLCSAVIMPKLLFVGRHAWPTGKIFDQLQQFIHQYAWNATLAEGASGGRARMSAGVAALPKGLGGMGLPDVRAAFLKMSKAVVTRWTQASNAVASAAGAVLLRLCSGGPAAAEGGASRLPPKPTRLATTMAATGHVALRAERALPRAEREQQALASLLPATGRGRIDEKWWQDGWFHCRYEDRATAHANLYATQRLLYGDFNLAAFLAALAVGEDVLHGSAGVAIAHSDFSRLFRSGDVIGDVIRIEWVGLRHVRFQSRTLAWPLTPRAADKFRRSCDTIVANYRAILLPHNDQDELQPRPQSEYVWRVATDDGVTTLVQEPMPGVKISRGVVHTMAAAAKLARLHDAQLLRFDPHPALDAYAPIWTSREQATGISPVELTPTHTRALLEVESRARQAIAADAVIQAALAKVTWSMADRLPASASHHRLLLHRIKGLRLSGWDRANNRRGCPHCSPRPHTTDLGHTFHTMWHCAAAQRLWQQLRDCWTRVGVSITTTPAYFCADVFSLRLRQTPPAAWLLLGPPGTVMDLIPLVHPLLEVVWQQQVLGCFQQIWRWRHGLADEARPWTETVASSALRGSFRTAFHQAAATIRSDKAQAEPLRRMLHGIQRLQLDEEPQAPPSPSQAEDQYLLFFDGGSRGNPGAGGAGAVMVRVDAFGGLPSIVWVATMSLADPKTTNNQAEYIGLVTGLRFADRQRLQPLTVIGDSYMIISQLRDHRAPKAPLLRQHYGNARILADRLSITKWCHHVRAYNKMADCAANLAMDSKCSVQTLYPTDRSTWSELATHLHEDVSEWQASTCPGQTSAG